MNLLAAIKLDPSFHCRHTWCVTLSDTEGEVTGKCWEAEGIWRLSAQELLDLPAEIRADHFSNKKSPFDYLDGITVNFLIISDRTEIEKRIHCPSYRFFPEYAALLQWCWNGLYKHSPEEYRVYLEQIYGYLDGSGAPVFRTPQGLRLFGRLTSSHAAELQKRLGEIAGMPEPVIDMSNFEGTGTLLYPIFKQFFQRSPASRWIVNSDACKQMKEAGIPKKSMIKTGDSQVVAASISVLSRFCGNRYRQVFFDYFQRAKDQVVAEAALHALMRLKGEAILHEIDPRHCSQEAQLQLAQFKTWYEDD